MGITMASSYIFFYMTERMLIPVAIVGAVLLAARIFDLVFGVAAGAIIQKISLKHGQYRSWLYYGPFMVSIGVIMLFINPPIPALVKAVMVFVGYGLYGAGMSFIQLSQNGIMSKIAGPNMGTRITIAGKIAQGQNAGRIAASVIIMPLVLFIGKYGLDGYTVTQIGIALCALFGQLPLFFKTGEYERYDPDFKKQGGASVSLGTMFATALKNGQLLIVMLADALRYAAMMALTTMTVYYFSYVAKNIGMVTLAFTVQNLLGFGSSLVMPAVARKIGKKNSGLISGLCMALFLAGMALWGGISPWVFIACMAGFTASHGLILACGVNLYLDCGEYQLYKTGKDLKAFTMSMFGVAIKVGFLLSTVVSTFILQASGYNGAAQTVADIRLMVLLLGGIPAVLSIVYMLLLMVYGITEAKAKEYAEHNFARAAPAASTAAPA